MAQRYVDPNTIVLAVAAIDGSEKVIVCLTDSGYTITNNSIKDSNFCEEITLPGAQSFDLPFSGHRILLPDTGLSEFGLLNFVKNKTHIQWTLGKVGPVAGDIIITGTGYLNTFTTTNAKDGIPAMNGTINAESSSVNAVETEGS